MAKQFQTFHEAMVSYLWTFVRRRMLIQALAVLTREANSYGLFGWRGEGGEVEENRLELIKNKLILC